MQGAEEQSRLQRVTRQLFWPAKRVTRQLFWPAKRVTRQLFWPAKRDYERDRSCFISDSGCIPAESWNGTESKDHIEVRR
nr:hypothetical protein [Deltaproteobacteria bacterium]